MPTKEQLDEALAGRYTIDRLIGEGGMATVYCARDIKHKRNVAVKVLRPDLGAVLGVERFLSEIQVTANLQHPHLLPLFDSGEAGGLLFYVMPFIEGESLRSRLDRERQLPVDEAVRLAVAIGSALDYAHRHGVIHRDLKPENILLHEGQPLVADFGIALAVTNAGGGRITQTGLSLGTPHYMSPEQATGDRVIDARTDIYSLGALTYEMLVGEPPHTGATSQAIIARVLTEKPRSIRSTRPSVPAHVEAAVQHALEKLPPDRFASAREFNEAISGARTMTWMEPAGGPHSEPLGLLGGMRRRELWSWGLAVVAVAVAALGWMRPGGRPPDLVPAEFELQLPDSFRVGGAGAGYQLAISPDGKTMVIVGRLGITSNLYVRRLNERSTQEIRGADGGRSPVFSADGSELLFTTASGQLKRIALVGGTTRTLSDSAAPNGQASWGDDGQVLYGNRTGLYLVSEDGGPSRLVAAPDRSRNHVAYGWPTILPGGRSALITIWKGRTQLEATRLGVVTIPDGKVTELGNFHGTNPRYSSAGHVLFATKDNQLYSAPFSTRSLELTGNPTLVVEGVNVGPGGPASFGISRNGTLVFLSNAFNSGRYLVTVNRSGEETQLNLRPGFYQSPRVSPDGQRIALTVFTGQGPAGQLDPNPDIWQFDLKSETATRVTTDSTSSRPVWSPDGSRIAYVRRTESQAMWRELYGNARAVPVAKVKNGLGIFEIAFGKPHGYGIIRVDTAASGDANDLYYFHTDSLADARPLLTEPYDESSPRISPDGRFIAYMTNKTGRYEVYLRSFFGNDPEILVTREGGSEPLWSPSGRELFYRSQGYVMSATIATSPSLAVTRRDSLFADRYAGASSALNYSVFPDGQRFAMLLPAGVTSDRQPPLIVRLNWSPVRDDKMSR